MTETLTIRQPDDWHVHLRDGEMLKIAAPFTAAQFRRAIVMPNLVPPVTTVAAGAAYRDRIMAALPDGVDFIPLMTAYLTDTIDPDEVARGVATVPRAQVRPPGKGSMRTRRSPGASSRTPSTVVRRS